MNAADEKHLVVEIADDFDTISFRCAMEVPYAIRLVSCIERQAIALYTSSKDNGANKRPDGREMIDEASVELQNQQRVNARNGRIAIDTGVAEAGQLLYEPSMIFQHVSRIATINRGIAICITDETTAALSIRRSRPTG